MATRNGSAEWRGDLQSGAGSLTVGEGVYGHTIESVRTTARVHLRNVEGAPTIARIELDTEGRIPGIDQTAG